MEGERGFTQFGAAHLAVLLLLFAVVMLLWGMGRWRPRWIRCPGRHRILAGILLGQFLGWEAIAVARDGFSASANLPLHLCDVCQLLLVAYLLHPRPPVYSLVYHWCLAGTALAMLWPDLDAGFPSVSYFAMFISHGLALAVIAHLTLIEHRWPAPGSHHAATVALVLYGMAVVPVNAVTGGNYLYLFHLPEVPFPLRAILPPAPWYWPLFLGFFHLLFTAMNRLSPGVRHPWTSGGGSGN